MFCFQSRFTRTLRGNSSSVKTDVPSTKLSSQQQQQQQQPTTPKKSIDTTNTNDNSNTIKGNTIRRNSEAASEDSGSSSIRYIDQLSKSESSSTDTLPGIHADYFESEPLSPGLVTLDIPSPSPTTTTTIFTNKKQILKKTNKKISGKWKKKLLLKLKNDNDQVCLINNDNKNIKIINNNNDGSKIIKASSTNDLLTLNGFSEGEDNNDHDVDDDDDEDDEDDDDEKEIDDNVVDDDDDDEDDDDDMEAEEEDYDEGCDAETETEEGSSMPSSPAVALSVVIAPSVSQVPYYDFLSVNGGSMRQETTSTSSPQLSSSSNTLINNKENIIITDDDRLSVSGDCCNPSVVGMNLIINNNNNNNINNNINNINNNKNDKLLDTPTTLPAARSCPNLEQQSIFFSSASCSNSPSPSPGPAGPRFRPIEEGDVQVCYLNHTRTLVSKILSSKFLRRWETHRLYLNDACLSSKTMTGFLHQSVPYSSMTEVYAVARWDPTYKYCLRIVLPDGSLLLQASNAYTRDQWYHSILWKKNIYKYQNTVNDKNVNEDTILRELKSMVDFSLWTPLQDARINTIPLEAVAKLLEYPILIDDNDNDDIIDEKIIMKNEELIIRNDSKNWAESVLLVASPLLEKSAPPTALARALSRITQKYPTSPLVESLGPAITRCLKHNVDFGKSQDMRKLIQMFIAALYENINGENLLRNYILSVHGPGSDCPHPRVLNNLLAICVAAIFHRFEVTNRGNLNTECISQSPPSTPSTPPPPPPLPPLECYLHVLKITSEYADWRPGLGEFLQPIPFPKDALENKEFQESMILPVFRQFANDNRCSVHKSLLPVREPRLGWIHIVAPSSSACPDDGTLFGEMLTTLLNCCCRRKKFMSSLLKNTKSACVLLGIRGCDAAQEALCLMLEWKLLTNEEGRQVVSALQSTNSGKERYTALCQRQRNLQELQQKGGPKKLTLPVRATDADVALLLGGGALGNLECLTLAFTSVTSACAEQLIRLPGLRYLNLWATQFGDAGLQMISEHLQKLQVLNLCETPVSDKGISTLASLTNLKKLNLNSTKLSAQAFELLKQRLPLLQECNVLYTEAWRPESIP